METSEFLLHARLETKVMEAWITEGWLLPQQHDDVRDFSEVDVARARLILDLQQLGVNEEGIPVILDLIDQVHGLRHMLRAFLGMTQAQSGSPPDAAADIDAPEGGASGRAADRSAPKQGD